MGDIDLLESVLAKESALVSNVRPDQLDGPTPCPEYDVRTLLNHIVGWLRTFAAGANGRSPAEDPTTYATEDHAGEFKAAADDIVAGWRAGGTDRAVSFAGNEMPGAVVLGMTLMEYVTHGCDLAIATGQEVPFSDEELETTLAHAQRNLADDAMRGNFFGPRVPVADDAPVLDRYLGFLGRRPQGASA